MSDIEKAMPALEPFVQFAEELAEFARDVQRQHFRKPRDVKMKSDGTPVSEADRQTEKILRDIIEEVYVDHGILGEEWGPTLPDADFVWIIDPIDGTRMFLTGNPLFTTLIGLAHRGRPVVGVIDQSLTGERWTGALGKPTTLNGEPIRVRPCPDIAQAWMYTAGPQWFEGENEQAFRRLDHEVLMTLYGADAYAFGLLAGGTVDLAIECGLKPHDYWALIPVIEGAGGVITDWQGQALTLDGPGEVLAAGDADLHRHAIAILGS